MLLRGGSATLIAAFCMLLATVDGYPTGPPSSACLNLQPFHMIPPAKNYIMHPGMAGTPKFAINVNSPMWTAGGSLTVTLTIASSTVKGFEGFIMRATRASSGFTNAGLGPLIGSFSCVTSAGPSAPPKYHSVHAPSGEQNCVSHSRAEDNLYKNVTCQWTAPATNEGPIVFSATVVVEFDEYQSYIQSATLSNVFGMPSNTTMDSTLTERPSLFGCGSTKTCAFYPPACDIRGGCRYGVTMTPQPSTGQLMFELFGNTFDWLSVGFGDVKEMFDLEIFTCGFDPKQKKVKLEYAFTPMMVFVPIYRSDITMVKTLMDTNSGGGMSLPVQPNTIYCQFTRPADSTFTYYSYNKSTLANTAVTFTSKMSGEGKFVVLAQGENVGNTPNQGKHTHIPLRAPVKFSSSGSPSTMYFEGLEAKVQTHGTLMTIFWLFLCGFGIIVARHTRPVLTQKVVKKQLWFLLHVSFMLLGYIIAIAGIIYILVKNAEWDSNSQVHGILGLIGMGLALLNILAGIFRPHPGTRFRPVFNRLHRWNGMLAFLFAGIAIWLGATFQVHRPEFRFWAVIVLGVWTVLQVVFMVGFEIARQKVVRNKREEQAIAKQFQMKDRAASDQSVDATSTQPLEQEEPKIKGKQLVHITEVWLAVYGCIFLGLAAAFWAGLWIH